MTQEQAFLCRTELVIFQAHTCSLQRILLVKDEAIHIQEIYADDEEAKDP